MGVKIKWTKQQDELIRKHYKYNLDHLLSLKCFSGRTKEAIIVRANRMGVYCRTWMAEEDEVIIKCYAEYGAAYCVRHLQGRTEVAIQSRALKLGVNRDLSKRKNKLPDVDVMAVSNLAYHGKWRKDK